jgi:hypothetical protein
MQHPATITFSAIIHWSAIDVLPKSLTATGQNHHEM